MEPSRLGKRLKSEGDSDPRRFSARREDVEIHLTLQWERFSTLTAARAAFATTPCVYARGDNAGRAIRIGKAGGGLQPRYRGGTGPALDAAMHGSGNCVFVAAVPAEFIDDVEAALIWEHRAALPYNKIGKLRAPRPERAITLGHQGEVPGFGSV